MAWDELRSIDEGSNPFGQASVVLIIGIIMFIIPYFESVLKFNLGVFKSFFTWVGIILIVIGAFISGIQMMDRR